MRIMEGRRLVCTEEKELIDNAMERAVKLAMLPELLGKTKQKTSFGLLSSVIMF